MLQENLERRITAIAIQIGHAEAKKISNVARSAHYRSAIILTCTVVEGLVYNLVKKKTAGGKRAVETKVEYKKLHSVPKSVFGKQGIVIMQEKEKKLFVSDEELSFQKMNRFLKRKKIITDSEFNKLEYVRRERNRIHLQALNDLDTGYTKQKLQKVTEPIEFLTEKH